MQPSILLSVVALLRLGAFTSAHGAGDEFPIPSVFGRRPAALPQHRIQQMQGYPPRAQSAHPQPRSAAHIRKRDWTKPDVDSKKQLRCGPGVGFCATGECCSPVGYCGQGYQHCASPNCQIDYSDGCDATIKPLGEPTLNVSRPLIGNVSYDGAGIDHCTKPGTVALTFDDGPYNYTSHLLDVLASHGAKATFFITGNNLGKGQIDIEETGWPDLIRRMHADGHQIAGHSWGHLNLTSLNETQLVNQVHYLEMALRNILGFIPTYFRPPYDDCQGLCPGVLKRLGYHITYQNVVNNDWQNDDGSKIEVAKDSFVASMNKTNPREVNKIFLLHDTHYQTSWNLTSYMLDYLSELNFSRSVTVGECMGDPPQNWYRTAGGAANHTLLLHRPRSMGSALKYSTMLLTFGQLMAIFFS